MVGKVCTVCRSCSFIDKDLSFFTYPGDPVRRYEWLKAVNRLDLVKKLEDDKTRGNHRICEIHFQTRFIQQSRLCAGRKFLTREAFPTLCLSPFNRGIPIMTDNFLKPTKPIPILNADTIIKKANIPKQNINKPKEEPVISRYNLRPIKAKIQQEEDSEDDDFDDDIEDKVPYQPYVKAKYPDSPLYSDDASQFCESVMKVTQSTQTNAMSEIKRILENSCTIKLNRIGEDEQSFSQMCSRLLSPNFSKLMKWQACAVNGNHVNFTLFSLNLYYSTNLYNFLSNMLNLPNKDTLKYYLLPKTTRVNEQFLNAFRCKINNMSPHERICSFSVGSITLKPSLYYDIKHDRIIGFHDVNGIQNTSLAKYAILLMVQGILEDWRQPIAYAFISGYNSIPEISMWIDETLSSLLDIGLDIRAFVSDPRSEFLHASESRLVTPDKTNFTINGRDIFYTYDTCQLLRIVKNNMKSCDFYYGSNSDNSNNVDFFEKINNLCNLLNAKSTQSNCQYKRAFSNRDYQKNFLNHMLEIFQNLKVVRRTDGIDVTENMKFIESFQISINTVQQLFEQLQYLGAKYLATNRLTHNSLKSFFTQVKRNSCKNECTPKEFNRAFVRNFVFKALKKPVNHKLDNSLSAEEYAQQLLDEEVEEIPTINNQPLLVQATDYRENLPEKNAFVYMCGYCYLKCIQSHNCDTFRNYVRMMKQEKEDEAYLCSVNLDINVQDSKALPPDDFTEFLLFLEYKFKEFFKGNVQITSVGQELLKEFEDCDFDVPCPCFPTDYLKALFIRIRLFYTIRKNNKIIKKRKGIKAFTVFSL